MTQSRLILCCNCPDWEEAENIELGTCRLKQGDGDIIENTTWYDSRCIYGLCRRII